MIYIYIYIYHYENISNIIKIIKTIIIKNIKKYSEFEFYTLFYYEIVILYSYIRLGIHI